MHLSGPTPGDLLVATPLLGDPNFARSVVFLIQHDEDGSMGVIIDRPTTIEIVEYLPTWEMVAAPPAVVFSGGPVDPEVGIGLAVHHAGVIEVVDLESDPEDRDLPVRVFAGYAGWGSGQLEAELAEGAWFVVASGPGDLTTAVPEDLWAAVLRRQQSNLAVYATYPPDPRLN